MIKENVNIVLYLVDSDAMRKATAGKSFYVIHLFIQSGHTFKRIFLFTELLLLALALAFDDKLLLLEHLGEVAVLVHGYEDIAATNELLFDV